MSNISVLDKVLKPGIVSIDCPDGRFQHELVSPRSDKSCVLDLASPLYYPSSKSKIYDRSGYGSHGTITGATWTRLPSGLWALDFNSATPDYVEIPADQTQLNFTSEAFSIIARIYIDDLTTSSWVFSRGHHSADGYYLFITPEGRMVILTNQLGTNQASQSTLGGITAGNWYTIGLSRDGTSIIPYRNGVDVHSIVGTHTDPATCARTAKIGIRDTLADPFDGKMEFLAIFSGVALSASEHEVWHNKLSILD